MDPKGKGTGSSHDDEDLEESEDSSSLQARKYVVVEETILGHNNFLSRMRALSKLAEHEDQIIVLFTGSGTPGESWCKDCNYFENFLSGFKNKPNGLNGYFVRVLVGHENEWQNEACPFRLDPLLHLKSIPAIMNWRTREQLSGMQIYQVDLLINLFGPSVIVTPE